MKKVNKMSMGKRWFLYGVIPMLLIAVWGVFTLLYITSYDKSFLLLSYNHSKDNFNQLTHDKLLAGAKISGEFTASEDNLGIVSMRFTLFSRPPFKNEDLLAFRIKEKGDTQWYYQSNYRSGLIYDVPLFPFGFPKISDSKGKQYVFELQSLKGNEKNSVALSKREPILISKYETSKQFLLADKKELLYFTLKKFNALKTTEVFFVSFIFLLPLIIYFLLLTPPGERLSNRINTYLSKFIPKGLNRKSEKLLDLTYLEFVLLLLLLFVIVSDIFVFQITYSAIYLVIISIWTYIVIHNGKSLISFVVACFFLVLSIILYYSYYGHLAEFTAGWAFLFLCSLMVTSLIEYKHASK